MRFEPVFLIHREKTHALFWKTRGGGGDYKYKIFTVCNISCFRGNRVIEPIRSECFSGENSPKLWILANLGWSRLASRFLILKWTQKIVLSCVNVIVHGWAQGILIGFLCCSVQTSLCQMLSSHIWIFAAYFLVDYQENMISALSLSIIKLSSWYIKRVGHEWYQSIRFIFDLYQLVEFYLFFKDRGPLQSKKGFMRPGRDTSR